MLLNEEAYAKSYQTDEDATDNELYIGIRTIVASLQYAVCIKLSWLSEETTRQEKIDKMLPEQVKFLRWLPKQRIGRPLQRAWRLPLLLANSATVRQLTLAYMRSSAPHTLPAITLRSAHVEASLRRPQSTRRPRLVRSCPAPAPAAGEPRSAPLPSVNA